MIGKNLIAAAGNGISTGDVAEAIDFDGTNDYLIANSLTGAADSKTFTLSAWVWPNTTAEVPIYAAGRNNLGTVNFYVYVTNSQELTISAYASGSTTEILRANLPASAFAKNTFNHVLISFDMASTSNRRIYINDVAVSPTYVTYTNTPLLFSTNTYRNAVGTEWIFNTANSKANGRLSNVFLDYTYRDLSITANRRLFVTADLKPAADQAALNPIIYLPLNDPTAPGANAGTGGNFTLTGTVARSGRGPNQYNAPYSTFDGAADYLSRTTALTGIADGKTFTVNLSFSYTAGTTKYIVTFGSYTFSILVNSLGSLNISANNSAGTQILLATTPNSSIVAARNYTLTASMDLANAANRFVYLNGVAQSVTWSIYTNDTIDFALATPSYIVGRNISTTYFNGKIGALWFNTSYIDLSAPDNLAKFVTGTGIDAKPVDLGATGELPTGTSPIIYLPMYGNNAGKNYGTGGDFTVNSGPYTGARGPNEFWSGSGLFNNPTQTQLSALTLDNSPDVTNIQKTTFACCFKRRDVDVTDNSVIFNTTSSTNNNFHFSAYFNASEQLVIGWNGHTVATSTAITDTNWHTLLVSVDSTATVARVYLDGVSLTATITLNRTYTQAFTYVGRATGVSADQCFDGNIGFIYQAHDYIDISQEANRLKFFDAFGYPVNLTQQVEDAAIPAAYVYLLFPESNLGTNNGTAGNFTNASVTASALVKA
jgi:hypothetical protein